MTTNAVRVVTEQIPGPRGNTGNAGATGATGGPGVDAVVKPVVTESLRAHAAQQDPGVPGSVRAADVFRTRRFAGLFTASHIAGVEQAIQHAGPVAPADYSLGVGLATAVGCNSAGAPVRVTDPNCVSGLNFIGWCDVAGTIFVSPRVAHRYEWNDYGLVPDWDGTTGTDNLPAMILMLAAMKRDAELAGSINRIQVAHFAGYFYFADTVHVQQGVVFLGDGPSNAFLHAGYHWSPGTQFTFPDGCHKLRFHSQGDFDELNPAPGATPIAIASVANGNGTDIVITSSTPHGLTSGDIICLSIYKVMSAAHPLLAGANKISGTWTVVVTGASTFKLEEPGHPGTNRTGNGDTVTGRSFVKCTVPWTNPIDIGTGYYPSAAYSQVLGITINGKETALVAGDGIRATCPILIRDVQIETVGGDGISITGDHTASGSNANGWLVENCTVGGVGGHGLRVAGGDTNGGEARHCNFAGTWGHAIYDAYNQGAKYTACQADGCGGEAGVGPFAEYYSDGVTCCSKFDTCYAENGISIILSPAKVDGGILSSPSRTDDRTTGTVTNGGGSFRGAIAQYDYTYRTNGIISSLGSNDASGSFWDWTQIGASYVRWKFIEPHDVVYAEVGGSSSSRTIGIPFSVNAIRSGQGSLGVAPIVQNGIFFGEVGASPTKIDYGSAAPTTLSWQRGDVRYNTAPTAGGNVGWVCVASGTPGTWKTFGVIES